MSGKDKTKIVPTPSNPPKTVQQILSQLSGIIDDLNDAARVAYYDVETAKNGIAVWEESKAEAENELERAKAIALKLQSIIS